ncbi:LLM class flavin-dependent oxidoreductase [Nocardia uniformis]|uniref:bacterial luciferase n=1 Tax=Nocardia uniformis TaxID=53432 RepID=A0A849CKN6_9NOCA|nr:LLM class flavin-dependent oxidoreductase [Nocardia uniformis]NNH75651.1 LLM class flavin-dependent oxidoreductase [Nocardia uniformis]
MTKFGIFLTTAKLPNITEADVFNNSSYYATLGEQLGFDSCWTLEHHFTPYGLCGDPLVMAAYLLGKTERLQVGTAVSVLPNHHPVQLAERVAMLDRLSNGRFLFGVGRGGFVKDFEVFDQPADKSHLIMREWMSIINDAFTHPGVVERDNEFIRIPAVPVYPTPQTPGGPPVYVVCESPSSTEWVASQGLPMMMSWWLEKDAMRTQIELYNDVAEAHGHDPEGVDHQISCLVSVGDSREQARAAVHDNFDWFRRTGQEAAFRIQHLRNLPNYAELMRKWEEFALDQGGDLDRANLQHTENILDLNVVGTPEYCVDHLGELMEATGVRHVLAGFEGPGTREAVAENMTRFAEEVIPSLKKQFDTVAAA